MKLYLYLLWTALIVTSCARDDLKNESPFDSESLTVTSEDAKNIAMLMRASDISRQSKMGTNSSMSRSDMDISPINGLDGSTAYFIITYSDGGFLILSADKRAAPVLAFSDSDNFPLEDVTKIEALQQWMIEMKSYVHGAKNSVNPSASTIERMWNDNEIIKYTQNKHKKIQETEEEYFTRLDTSGMPWVPHCPTQIAVVGPLTIANWDQGTGYNGALQPMGCTWDFAGKPYTGCVATAMSQIMKFHNYPSQYNWAAMPMNAPSDDIAYLMRDVGNAVNMNWGCSASGANTESSVPQAFKNDFGYSTAQYRDDVSISHTIESELIAGRPVILRGGRNVNGSYQQGHAWVCSGSRRTYYFNQTTCLVDFSTFEYYMNWGWGGSFNGWYFQWTPGSNDFSYKKGIVYNIKP